MTWDITTPSGSEAQSNGDNRIRELKTDLQTALRGNDTDGTEAKFPGSDTANPVYRYRGRKGNTAGRPAAGQYGLYANTTTATLQRDNGSAWEDIATLIPAGTKMVFYQASAPTGWTLDSSQNDKALRVVSGSGGGTGGTQALSASFAHTHAVGAHTHTVASHVHGLGSHTHSTPNHAHNLAGQVLADTLIDVDTDHPIGVITAPGYIHQLYNITGIIPGQSGAAAKKIYDYTENSGSGNTGAAAGNTDGTALTTAGTALTSDSNLDVKLAYIDVIVCAKD